MASLLKLVPLWAWVLLAGLLGIGIQTWRLHSEQTAYSDYKSQVADGKLKAEREAREEEQRRQDEAQRIREDAAKQKAQDDAAAAAELADRQRMQQQISGLLADRRALNSRLAARGKTIEDLSDLLAKLRREADDYAGDLAARLDESRRAGFLCERAYDSLTVKGNK